MPGGPGANAAAIQALWSTVKSQLATVQADLNQAATDAATLEANLDLLYGYGAGDLVDWVRNQYKQTRLGYRQRISAGGNVAPFALNVGAPDAAARDTSNVDQRPISSTATGSLLGLT